MIVGQAPSRRTVGRPALSGRSGALLARLSGVETLSSVFVLANLSESYTGSRSSGAGDAWSASEARKLAAEFDFGDERRIILLGWNVARAFCLDWLEYMEWFDEGDFSFAVFPHPSGLNHFWNDPENRERARTFLVAEGERCQQMK